MKFQSLGLEAAWCYVLVPWWWEEQCTTVRWNHGAGRFRCSMVQWCSFLNLFFWLVTEWAIVCKLFLLPCLSSQYTMWRQFSCPLLAPGCFGCCNGWCCLGFPLLQAGKPSAHCAGWSMLKWLDGVILPNFVIWSVSCDLSSRRQNHKCILCCGRNKKEEQEHCCFGLLVGNVFFLLYPW